VEDKYVDWEDIVKRLSSSIEGYVGYDKPDERAISDRALRSFSIARLEEARKLLDEVGRILTDQGFLDTGRRMFDLRDRVKDLINTLGSEEHLKNKFFKKRKISEEVVSEVVYLDNKIVKDVNELTFTIDKLYAEIEGGAVRGLGVYIFNISKIIERIKENIGKRSERIVLR